MSFKNHLYAHSHPVLLWKNPLLIRAVHTWNSLVLQRNWVINRTLSWVLPALPVGGLVVDAGCGNGQHIFPFFKKNKHVCFMGFDKNEGNIAFCKKYSQFVSSGQRLRFFHQNLEKMRLENKADLLLCVGTLQYIVDDQLVLDNFYKALKPGCNLLLYTPVEGREILPLYSYFFNKLEHYERSQDRIRVYLTDGILDKLTIAGFRILKQYPTYGTPGIIGHEIYSLLLMGIGNAAWWWAWVFVPLGVVLFPFVLIFKWLDFILPKKSGNGLLVVAGKPR